MIDRFEKFLREFLKEGFEKILLHKQLRDAKQRRREADFKRRESAENAKMYAHGSKENKKHSSDFQKHHKDWVKADDEVEDLTNRIKK